MNKKSLLLILLTLSSFTLFQSCKRDYTCSCLSVYKGTYSKYDSSISYVTRKDAIYDCDKLEADWMTANMKGDRMDTLLNCNLNKD